jgi:hypothetical protein
LNRDLASPLRPRGHFGALTSENPHRFPAGSIVMTVSESVRVRPTDILKKIEKSIEAEAALSIDEKRIDFVITRPEFRSKFLLSFRARSLR